MSIGRERTARPGQNRPEAHFTHRVLGPAVADGAPDRRRGAATRAPWCVLRCAPRQEVLTGLNVASGVLDGMGRDMRPSPQHPAAGRDPTAPRPRSRRCTAAAPAVVGARRAGCVVGADRARARPHQAGAPGSSFAASARSETPAGARSVMRVSSTAARGSTPAADSAAARCAVPRSRTRARTAQRGQPRERGCLPFPGPTAILPRSGALDATSSSAAAIRIEL